MKKILLASTALAFSAGMAAAEVEFSGDAGFGVATYDHGDAWFEYYVDLYVSMTGTSDGGLEFGADFTFSQSGTSAGFGWTASGFVVYLSGDFGKVSVGADASVDTAVEATMLGLADIGWTEDANIDGIGENFVSFSDDEFILYTGTFGDLTVAASADAWDGFSLGAKYDFGDYAVALGYEHVNNAPWVAPTDPDDIFTISGEAAFGDVTVGALASFTNDDDYALGMDLAYSTGAWGFGATAVYSDVAADGETFGIGVDATYDLGGGLSITGGVAYKDVDGVDETYADLGIDMTF